MIPLNLWNSMSNDTRVRIANAIYECSILDTAMYRDLAYPFHHNFNHSFGKTVLNTLKHLNKQKDGTINVTINITPKYVSKKPVSTPTKKKVNYIEEIAEKHFRVSYLDKDGDLTNVHLYADSVSQAKEKAKEEYWDIESIVECYEID